MFNLFQKNRPFFRDLLNSFFSDAFKSLVTVTGLIVLQGICAIGLAGCGRQTVIYEADAVAEDEADAEAYDVKESMTEQGAYEVSEEAEESEDKLLIVHLCGAVNNPGVYELEIDSRVIDGIREAGGFRDDASEDTLNLAMELKDGSRIYVPTVDEVSEDNEGKGYADTSSYITIDSDMTAQTGKDGAKVNINTADSSLLTTLPGIGQTRAESIISYREAAGGFGSVEEIKNVSGIGDASFEKLKDKITVN